MKKKEIKDVTEGTTVRLYSKDNLSTTKLVKLEPTKSGKSIKYTTENGFCSTLKATTIVWID